MAVRTLLGFLPTRTNEEYRPKLKELQTSMETVSVNTYLKKHMKVKGKVVPMLKEA
jgi:hypothetical protein